MANMNTGFDNALLKKLQSSPFWARVGFKPDSCNEDRVRIRLPYDPGNTTTATALHGGVIADTLDTAGCLAAWMTSELGRHDLFGSTINTKVKIFAVYR